MTRSTSDLGLEALVADQGNGSVVPAVVAGLALAGAGLAVIESLSGQKVSLKDLPTYRIRTSPAIEGPQSAADWVHPRCPCRWRDVQNLPPEVLDAYRDWLLESKDMLGKPLRPDTRKEGEMLAMRMDGKPYVTIFDLMGENGPALQVNCWNVRYKPEDVLDLARQATRLGGYSAEMLLPDATQIHEFTEVLHRPPYLADANAAVAVVRKVGFKTTPCAMVTVQPNLPAGHIETGMSARQW